MADGPVWRCRECGGTVKGDSTDPDVLRLGIRDHKIARHSPPAMVGVAPSTAPAPAPDPPTLTPEQGERITLERSVPMLAQMVQDLTARLNETRAAVALLADQRGITPPAIAANGMAPTEAPADVVYQGPEAPRGGGMMEMLMPLILKALLGGGSAATVADPAAALAPLRGMFAMMTEIMGMSNTLQLGAAELRAAHHKELTETLKASMAAGADPASTVDAIHDRTEHDLARVEAARRAVLPPAPPAPPA